MTIVAGSESRSQAHVELYFGDDVSVFHGLLSDQVHVDVYMVRATPERRFQYLVTSGMSERAMRAPEGNETCSYAELCLALPPEWPLPQEAFKVQMPDGREVWFLSPIPVYPEEMQLKLDQGSEALAERLAGAGVSE